MGRTVTLFFENVPDDITAEDLASSLESVWLAAGVEVSQFPPSENVGGL